MDDGMLEEAVGAKLIYNAVPQPFWNGSVLNYLLCRTCFKNRKYKSISVY
jgi:hypothetical protein